MSRHTPLTRAAKTTASARKSRKRIPLHRWFESLESRRLLTTFHPLPTALDGAANSLRADVIAANSDGVNDTFDLKTGTYNLTLTNTAGQENAAATGDLDLTESGHSITFDGNGVNKTFINANQIDRVFQIFSGVTVTFKNLTITGGKAIDDGHAGAGATPGSNGEAEGGGILDQGGFVTLDNVVLNSNAAAGLAGLPITGATGGNGNNAAGGGIHVTGGSLTMTSSTIENNQALGGIGANGTTSFNGGNGGGATGGAMFVIGGTTLNISKTQPQ